MARGNPKFLKTGAEHPSSKKVDQLTVEGKYIRSFDSIKQAAEAVGLRYQSISNAIRKNATSGHYKWRYSTH